MDSGKNKNTELACLRLVDRILPTFIDGTYCICVFLDFSACFDTISRTMMMKKLERYGVNGPSLQFVESYFADRQQCVIYSGVKSDTLNQDLGTIQGSKNGPRFFDIYSNDMNFLLNDDHNVLYADDTTIVYVHDNLDILTEHVNCKLSQLLDWCRFNKMIINPDKSHYILVTNKCVPSDPIIKLGQENIQRVGSCKYLGMFIDEKLKYHDLLAHMKSKLRQLKGISFRLRKFLDRKTARNFYFSMVYSTVTYCISVWGGVLCCTRRGDELQKLQTSIVKNLFNEFSSNNMCIFKTNEILKLIDVYKFYVSLYMYKILKLDLHPTLSNDLNLRINEHMYGTRNRENFVHQFPRTENIRINYEYMFPKIWNSIPSNIKDATSLSVFKKRLKQYFLDQY